MTTGKPDHRRNRKSWRQEWRPFHHARLDRITALPEEWLKDDELPSRLAIKDKKSRRIMSSGYSTEGAGQPASIGLQRLSRSLPVCAKRNRMTDLEFIELPVPTHGSRLIPHSLEGRFEGFAAAPGGTGDCGIRGPPGGMSGAGRRGRHSRPATVRPNTAPSAVHRSGVAASGPGVPSISSRPLRKPMPSATACVE